MANLKQFRMGDFRGVDFSSSPLNASYTRAVAGKNWINEYGANKKRNGWEQILPKLGDKINGIFPYQVMDGMEMLVFTDKRAFRVYFENDEWVSVDVSDSAGAETYAAKLQYGDLKNLANRKLMAVYGKNGIYIPAGGYYFYHTGNKKLYELNAYYPEMTAQTAYGNSDMIFVPTTTINISPNGYASTSETLDSENLLMPYRINKLIGKPLVESTSISGTTYSLTFTLDSSIQNNDYYLADDSIPSGSGISTSVSGNRITFSKSSSSSALDGREITVVFRYNSALISSTSLIDPFLNFCNLYPDLAVGSNPVCTTFGIAGYSDRIFLAGNGRGNRVYFSEEDDYTYFPHDFYADIGTSATKITAFQRLADDTLAIYKEQNGNDPAVYYMTGRRDYTYNDDGTVKKITPVFSFSAGATTETAVNAFVTGTLSGDSLITSKHGVYAIALTENYATNTRTARERSRLINARLQNMDLSEAVSIVWRGKYYLAVGSEVFIADANFKWQPNDGEWWQYEWYYWDHVPVRVWAVMNDTLMFGTEDGRLCAFDDADLYKDTLLTDIQPGQITGDDDVIAFSDSLDDVIQDGKRVYVKNDLYRISASVNLSLANDVFSVDPGSGEDFIKLVNEGSFVELTDDDETNTLPFTVEAVDRVAKTVDLSGFDTEYFDGSTHYTARLFEPLDGKTLYIVGTEKAQGGGGTFQLAWNPDGESPIDIEPNPNATGNTPSMAVYDEIAVSAEWKTPVFDMGTNTHRKTLLRLTISADNVLEGTLQFGYETRQNASTRMAKGIQFFTFDALDFANFTIDMPFSSSYTVRARERGFNYIQFYFKSESPTNCVVNDLTATYRIIAENRGVR